ncbi:hypothetical protein QUA56_23335 [Microcoleus sp. N3A4]|uniref:hypothetical protein n=1 Tax=Microcoleus sp. N3A4 TaxID=3055379 RepID=UPI002FD66816
MNKTLQSSNVNQNLNEQPCKHEPEMGRKCQKAAKATFFKSFNSKALAKKTRDRRLASWNECFARNTTNVSKLICQNLDRTDA